MLTECKADGRGAVTRRGAIDSVSHALRATAIGLVVPFLGPCLHIYVPHRWSVEACLPQRVERRQLVVGETARVYNVPHACKCAFWLNDSAGKVIPSCLFCERSSFSLSNFTFLRQAATRDIPQKRRRDCHLSFFRHRPQQKNISEPCCCIICGMHNMWHA